VSLASSGIYRSVMSSLYGFILAVSGCSSSASNVGIQRLTKAKLLPVRWNDLLDGLTARTLQ
jgi:hypothetical protein